MLTLKRAHVAVIGAGLSGAACAWALAQAGHRVHVFDKSRGPGGRMATRRLQWADALGPLRTTAVDHGALGITASEATLNKLLRMRSAPAWDALQGANHSHSPAMATICNAAGRPRRGTARREGLVQRCPNSAFQSFLASAEQAGCLARWQPRLASDSLPLDSQSPWWVPVPDGPALCRHLLGDTAATWSYAVDHLQAGPAGWQVSAGTDHHPEPFDAVVLALPPAQAAPLLLPHRSDWARHATVALMQPCWTLMGVAQAPTAETAPPWQGDLCRPQAGPLAWVMRNDHRPGRQPVPGQAHWVVHASAGWSRQHVEQPAAWVQQTLQSALAQVLGYTPKWLHSVVHRWRYATPAPARDDSLQPCWWDADRQLGVCGDFLGGRGIEGAWLSAQALSQTMLSAPREVGPVAPALQGRLLGRLQGRLP